MSKQGKKEVCDLVLEVLKDLERTMVPVLGQPIKRHIDLGFEMVAQKKFVEAATAFDAGLALDPYDDECKRGKQEIQRIQVLYLYRHQGWGITRWIHPYNMAVCNI